MGDEERKIKGRVLNNYMKFIKKKWGVDGFSDCQRHTKLNLSEIHDDRWYMSNNSDKIQKWIADAHGIDCCRQLGFSIVTEIGIISYAARIAGIRKVLSRATEEYKENLAHGQIDVQMSKNNAVILFKDVNRYESNCQTWIGIFEGIMHITKTKGTVKKTACEVKGDDSCTYELEWK